MKNKFILPEVSSVELSCEDAIMTSAEITTDTTSYASTPVTINAASAELAAQYARWKGFTQ